MEVRTVSMTNAKANVKAHAYIIRDVGFILEYTEGKDEGESAFITRRNAITQIKWLSNQRHQPWIASASYEEIRTSSKSPKRY